MSFEGEGNPADSETTGEFRPVRRVFEPMRDVEEFHAKFGLTYDGKPRVLVGLLDEFRRKFLGEELKEYVDHSDEAIERLNAGLDPAPAMEEQLDALVDLVYVALGTAEYHGFNFREAWRRVHEANMRKERATTPSERGGLYDVVKPPGWEAPSHTDLVADHTHKEEL